VDALVTWVALHAWEAYRVACGGFPGQGQDEGAGGPGRDGIGASPREGAGGVVRGSVTGSPHSMPITARLMPAWASGAPCHAIRATPLTDQPDLSPVPPV